MLSEKLAREAMARFSNEDSALVRWLKSAIDDKRIKSGDVEFMSTQFFFLLKGFAFWPQVVGHTPRLSAKEQQKSRKKWWNLLLPCS